MPENPEDLSSRRMKRAASEISDRLSTEPESKKRIKIAKMGNEKNPQQQKKERQPPVKNQTTKAATKAKYKARSPTKSSEKANSAKPKSHDSDEESEDNQPSSQVPTLWSFLRHQEVRTRIDFDKEFCTSVVVEKKRFREIDRDDGDVNPHDSDYEDADHGYGSGEDGCVHEEYVMAEQRKDADAESKMVQEDIAERSNIGFTIPDYKPKGEHAEPKKRDEISVEVDDEKRAWKALNAFIGKTVTKAASLEYVRWHDACTAFFAQPKSLDFKQNMSVSFPSIAAQDCGFGGRDCLKGEKMRICQHDLLRVLKGSGVQVEGEQWVERLKRERLRWHPDKFSGKMGKQWEDEAKEMFQMIQVLIERAES